MNKIKKIFIASCLLCATMAVSGTAAACGDAKTNTSSTTTGTTITGVVKKDFDYAPDITIEWGEYSAENIPNAVKDEPYRIFEATAEDVYSDEVDITTRVYQNYLEATKALVTLKDNTVTPTRYGVYTVEYTAIDMFDNVSVYTYDFTCADVETLSVTLGKPITETITGVETPIATYSYDREIGNVTTKITATHKGGKVVYDLTDETSFVPMYAGDYTIEYTCTDYNLTVTESYDITVEKNPEPVFLGSAAMPKYFIVGEEYTLPSVEAYIFITGDPSLATPVITVKQGKEKEKQLSGYSYTPDKEGELTITYTITCGANKKTQTYMAQAVDVGEDGTTFDITKYFYATDATVTADNDAVTVAANKDGAKVQFINTLPSWRFSLKLSTDLATSNFTSIDIYLTDSVDESVQLKITYAAPGKKDSYISVNEGEMRSANLYEGAVQTISYDEATKEISFNGGISLSCPKGFAGFPSGQVNFSLQFNGVKGDSQVKLFGLNNQTLYALSRDYFAPEIQFEVPAKDTFSMNEVVALGAVEFADVLDPEATLFISVLSPTDEYVTSESGILLNNYVGDVKDCDFRTTEYGVYIVFLKVVDGKGNEKSYNYTVNVIDVIAPEVTFVSKMPKTVNVGEEFTLSEIIVTDDITAAENCELIVVLIGGPVGDVKVLTAGNTYTFETKGDYYLYYIVEDEAGNTTTLCHSFIVE